MKSRALTKYSSCLPGTSATVTSLSRDGLAISRPLNVSDRILNLRAKQKRSRDDLTMAVHKKFARQSKKLEMLEMELLSDMDSQRHVQKAVSQGDEYLGIMSFDVAMYYQICRTVPREVIQ